MTISSGSGRNRTVLTGASSGIGQAFAERLAREGYDVSLVARRRDRLEGLAERLRRDFGTRADVKCADLTEPEALAKVEARVTGDDALALLVNNAGFGSYMPFASIDPRGIDDLIDIHVRAVTRLTRAALLGMIRRGAGGTINISSVCAKAFMLAFTQALAGQLSGTCVKV